MQKKSIAVNTVLNTIRMTLTIFVPLLTYPYITRIFGSDGIGQYEWVKSVVSILSLIASMGISTYAVREGTKVREDRAQFTKFAQELFLINLFTTIVCYIALFILIICIPKFTLYKTYLLIYSINIALSALSLDWVYSVYEDYLYITIRQIIVQVLSIAGLFLLVHDKQDLVIYIIITTISNSGANIFNFVRSKKYVDFMLLKQYNLKKHWIPVIVFFGTRFAMNAYNSLDTFILGMLSSNDAVGYYNVAVKINSILITFFGAMSPVYLPRMIKYITEHQRDNYDRLLSKTIKLKTILIYPMVCGLFLFAPQIVWLIAGDGFEDSIMTLRILCFVLGFVLLSSIVQKDILIPSGKEKIVLKITLYAALFNVFISIVLIICIGHNGAAFGSLLAEGLVFFIGVKIVDKEGYSLWKRIIYCSYKYILATIIMSISCFILIKNTTDNYLVVCLGIPIAVIIYFGTILLLKDDFFYENSMSIIKKILKTIKVLKDKG